MLRAKLFLQGHLKFGSATHEQTLRKREIFQWMDGAPSTTRDQIRALEQLSLLLGQNLQELLASRRTSLKQRTSLVSARPRQLQRFGKKLHRFGANVWEMWIIFLDMGYLRRIPPYGVRG